MLSVFGCTDTTSLEAASQAKWSGYCQKGVSIVLRVLAWVSPQVLSSMLLGPKSFLQRWHVKCHSGEEVILTVQLHLEETVEPQ